MPLQPRDPNQPVRRSKRQSKWTSKARALQEEKEDRRNNTQPHSKKRKVHQQKSSAKKSKHNPRERSTSFCKSECRNGNRTDAQMRPSFSIQELRSQGPFREESSGDKCLLMTPPKSEKSVQLNARDGAAGPPGPLGPLGPLGPSPLGAGRLSPPVAEHPTLNISDRCLNMNRKTLNFSNTEVSSTTSESASSEHRDDLWEGWNLD